MNAAVLLKLSTRQWHQTWYHRHRRTGSWVSSIPGNHCGSLTLRRHNVNCTTQKIGLVHFHTINSHVFNNTVKFTHFQQHKYSYAQSARQRRLNQSGSSWQPHSINSNYVLFNKLSYSSRVCKHQHCRSLEVTNFITHARNYMIKSHVEYALQPDLPIVVASTRNM